MRVVVCTNSQDKIIKLVWLNEDSKGVYVGMYGEAAGIHFSYHADGMRHMRIPKNDEFIARHQFIPIDEIDSYVQVVFSGINLESDNVYSVAYEYEQDSKSTAEVFLPSSMFAKDSHISMSFFLLNRQREQEFIAAMRAKNQPNVFDLVSLSMFKLENFPNHKASVVFLSKK